MRALRLSPRELLRLDASFELYARAHHANGTRRDGQAGGGMRYRCHPWVELFGRNSSTDCTQHDNKIRDKIRSENRADQAADDPSGSSRGAHNYPSPNAALARTQGGRNDLRTSSALIGHHRSQIGPKFNPKIRVLEF